MNGGSKRNLNNNIIIDQLGLTDKQFNDLQEKYAYIEPIISDYTNPKDKQRLRLEAQANLGISERTLRQWIFDFKKYGIKGLLRQNRRDKGKYRKFLPELLEKSKKLLQENPYRSVKMLLRLLSEDQEYRDKIKLIK